MKNTYLVQNPINIGNRMSIHAELNKDYVYIGRLSGEKGANLFCEAVTKADVHGIIIGNGNLEDSLKIKYPNIDFLGWQNKSQINEQLKKARALIFPTLWYEGSPLTVPEVQAHGIPCIVTNCSSATDDIIDGFNGEIVEPELNSIVKAIRRFNDDEYVKKLSKNTRETWNVKRSDYSLYAENLLNVYGGNL